MVINFRFLLFQLKMSFVDVAGLLAGNVTRQVLHARPDLAEDNGT